MAQVWLEVERTQRRSSRWTPRGLTGSTTGGTWKSNSRSLKLLDGLRKSYDEVWLRVVSIYVSSRGHMWGTLKCSQLKTPKINQKSFELNTNNVSQVC